MKTFQLWNDLKYNFVIVAVIKEKNMIHIKTLRWATLWGCSTAHWHASGKWCFLMQLPCVHQHLKKTELFSLFLNKFFRILKTSFIQAIRILTYTLKILLKTTINATTRFWSFNVSQKFSANADTASEHDSSYLKPNWLAVKTEYMSWSSTV